MQTQIDLKPYTTFGISSIASYFETFNSTEKLISVLNEVADKKLLILGGGSNLLLTSNFDGVVLKNEIKGINIVKEDEHSLSLQVGAGEVWHELVIYCIEKGYYGLENLSLIPGSVGASPMQNIGAYGVEIKDVFESLEALNIETKETLSFSKEACKFGYRESVFKHELKGKYIITSVTFKLSKKENLETKYGAIESQLQAWGIENPNAKDVSEAVIAIRTSKLPNPKEIGNAGSFFKNPVVSIHTLSKIQENYPNAPFYPISEESVKIPAGWLIETAGWKGKTIGECGVHTKQALVLVNYGNAKGKEIFALSEQIIQDVYTKFSVTLEREVNII
jgi:UDP-N-acetylmuramate dehydrogenase